MYKIMKRIVVIDLSAEDAIITESIESTKLQKLNKYIADKTTAIKNQFYEEAATIRDLEKKILSSITYKYKKEGYYIRTIYGENKLIVLRSSEFELLEVGEYL